MRKMMKNSVMNASMTIMEGVKSYVRKIQPSLSNTASQ